MKVYDASFNRPSPNQVGAGNGIILYGSYVDPQTSGKIPSIDEVNNYRNAGVEVGFVYEWYETRATEDYASGYTDGQIALSQFRARNHAEGKVAFAACDTVNRISGSYIQGYRDGLSGYYKPGIYAGADNLRIAEMYGINYFWEAKSESWDGTKGELGYAQLVQQLNSDLFGTDLNIVYGDWIGLNPITLPPSTNTEEDEEMPIIFRNPLDGRVYRDSETVRSPDWIPGPSDLNEYIKAGYKTVNLSQTEVNKRLAGK